MSSSFESVAGEYEKGRPRYPAELFDAIEQLAGMFFDGLTALDVGAGTGIATRELHERGARVVALDHGPQMLSVLRSRLPDVAVVVGDANALPLRDSSVDLVTCAQAWHWVDHDRAPVEVTRVLRPEGVVAVWWNIAEPVGEPWFAEHRARLRATDGGAMMRLLEAAAERVADDFRGADVDVVQLRWSRVVTKEIVLADVASKSYVVGLGPQGMQEFLDRERALLPDGNLLESYVIKLTVVRPAV